MNVSAKAAELFDKAQALPVAERENFLVEACAGDDDLLTELRSLLAAAARSEVYFERLSNRVGLSSLADDDHSLPANRLVGKWRLSKVIGRGGMGAVYLAERADDQFEQQAALKILPIGLDTGAARMRFLGERQILAGLSHENIARLLDGGVIDDGTPYFVMEYIDGSSIIDHCDQSRLDVDARIRLFLEVLSAVSHAHKRLIIHRDIKPSNVLVDKSGRVKLLDFGVAKLMRSDAAMPGDGLTVESGVAMTPEYAAPEQLLGQDVTTATDVYALGLMLYELLSGCKPRGSDTVDSFATLVEMATRDVPKASAVASNAGHRAASPQALQRKLDGDLDTVLQKALAPDADDRYATVDAFASDLSRYLAGEPVSAMPPTLRYRALKFVGRHRGGVATTFLTALALMVSLVFATMHMLEARKQRDIAIYQQQRVLASNEFLTLMLGEIGAGGEPLTLGELLDRSVDMLERSFGDDNLLLSHMYFSLAESHLTFGQGKRAITLLSRAESAARDARDADLLAGTLCLHAVIVFVDDVETANDRLTEANAILDRIDRASDATMAVCARGNALRLQMEDDRPAAIEVLRAAVRRLDASGLASVQTRVRVMNNLLSLYHESGRLEEALALNDRILGIMRRSGRGASTEYIINALNRSVLMASLGEVLAAFEVRQEVVERMGLFETLDELQASGRAPIATLAMYAGSLVDLARYDEALTVNEQALLAARMASHDRYTARGEVNLALVLMHTGRLEAALEHVAVAEAAISEPPAVYDMLRRQAALVRAQIVLRQGDVEQARLIVDAELERLGYPVRNDAAGLAATLGVAAEVALAAGDASDAQQFADEAYDLAAEVARDPGLSADVGRALLQRARARLMLGDRRGLQADLRRAVESLTSGLGDDHPLTREARALRDEQV
jgi:serine/threonine-protein kinase